MGATCPHCRRITTAVKPGHYRCKGCGRRFKVATLPRETIGTRYPQVEKELTETGVVYRWGGRNYVELHGDLLEVSIGAYFDIYLIEETTHKTN